MRGLVKFVVFLIIASGLGMFTAQYVVQGKAGLFTHKVGAWTTWPSAGTVGVDPYTRSHFLSLSKLPSSRFEEVEYEALADDEDRALNSDCVYTLRGRMPAARWWSLSTYNAKANADTAVAVENAVTSRNVIYEYDGTIVLTIANDPQPGNWIRPAQSDKFTIVFRLYNPVGTEEQSTYSGALLTITREICR